MAAVIVAQFDGECAECGQSIKAGQPITPRIPPGDDIGDGLWRHVTCPKSADEAALEAGRCPRCGLHHPGEC